MNLPKTIQCGCGSYNLRWVRTSQSMISPRVAHYECRRCAGIVKIKLTEKCCICNKRECIHIGKETKE